MCGTAWAVVSCVCRARSGIDEPIIAGKRSAINASQPARNASRLRSWRTTPLKSPLQGRIPDVVRQLAPLLRRENALGALQRGEIIVPSLLKLRLNIREYRREVGASLPLG